MNKQNYQKEMEKILLEHSRGSRLLLHSCCAPCSSYCMEYLREYFQVTVFYYNPNITEAAEYQKRVEEEKKLIQVYNEQVDTFSNAYPNSDDDELAMEFSAGMRVTNQTRKIDIIEGSYEPEAFWKISKGLETCQEGGERCFACYELRLRETARVASQSGYDFFTTTLTISPLKNAEKLNELGRKAAAEYGISFLPSDFKKKNGYKRSVELSDAYALYRQDYCGCAYSKAERLRQKQIKLEEENVKQEIERK